VATPSGYAQGDNIHFNAAGSRLIGGLIADNV
jgi:lysophospholipase L1-like esterase